jgi:threonine synthase
MSDFTPEETKECVNLSYSKAKFETEEIAPIYKLSDSEYILETLAWATCAFKDMALQILPKFLTGL